MAEHLRRKERMVREDEQRATVGAAKNDVEGTFRNIDLSDNFALRAIDEDLSVCHIDVSTAVDGHALAAALSKRFEDRRACRPGLLNPNR